MNGIRALACFVIFLSVKLVIVSSQANGDISLSMRGPMRRVVRVYYSKEHKYLPLCWQQSKKMKNIADTVCRQLGFTKAQSHYPKQFKGLFRMYGNYINIESCESDTLHILRCVLSSPVVSVKCPNNRLLRINCTTQQYQYEGHLKLEPEKPVPTNSTSKGILKVYLNNEWTAVCNDTFGDDEADSSCRQLGYTNALASHGKYYDYSNNMMWIGTEKDGRLSCPTSEPCLTKCYSKPKYKENCNVKVYLECEFDIKNANQLSAGSKSVCVMAKEDSGNGSIAGIVLGSISLAFVCIFGILVILYCCTRSERPLTSNLTTSITYNYSHVGSQGDECVKKEQEEEFNDSDAGSYEPPTPLVEK